MEFIISGLIFGLVTSLHCAGMCGPIAIALPLQGNTKGGKILNGLLYNTGRTTTYVILGVIFGLIGHGLGALGIQRWISIATGAIMILTVLFPSIYRFDIGTKRKKFSIGAFVQSGLKKLFSIKTTFSIFFIGMLNGLLPCGPVYSALIISTGAGDFVLSVLFMLMFGLGTIPLLLFISLIGDIFNARIRAKLSKALPVLIVIMGILFILRGMNLGIPFLSPTEEKIEKKFNKTKEEQKKNKDGKPNVNCIDTKGCCSEVFEIKFKKLSDEG